MYVATITKWMVQTATKLLLEEEEDKVRFDMRRLECEQKCAAEKTLVWPKISSIGKAHRQRYVDLITKLMPQRLLQIQSLQWGRFQVVFKCKVKNKLLQKFNME